jgi:tetratricopeptide (TPR) repeat protein
LFEEALRVWRAAGYRVGIALATANLGRVAARAGEFEQAHGLLDDALELFTSLGAKAFVDETRARILECLVLEGRHQEAVAAAGRFAERDSMIERLSGYATVQARAPFEQAKVHFDAALAAAREANRPYELALVLRALAETTKTPDREADRILAELGVVSTPRVPLPWS